MKQPIDASYCVTEAGHAIINNKRFSLESYKFDKIIGRGANAIVFKARSQILNRDEAVKIFLPRKNDARNKITQGSFEAQKQAQSAFNFPSFRIANVFHVGIIDGYFYSTMELIDAPSMREWIKTATIVEKWRIAHLYNDAMRHISREDLFHGDPHMGNILVSRNDIAIIDFGTSKFSNRRAGWLRHWKIVDEVMNVLLRDFEDFSHYRSLWPSTEHLMMWGAYRDVLRALTAELFHKTDGTPDELDASVKGAWTTML